MDIHFYLNNTDGTQITSMYNLSSNPFKIGDEISLEVEELYPVDYNKFGKDLQIKLLNSNAEFEKKFRLKKVKLIREGKYMKFNVLKESILTIEYHCVYSKDY
jgi:hypothetical protein